MNKKEEFKRLLNLTDFDLDYESLEHRFVDLNKLAAKIAGTEISQLNLIDHYTQWSISQVGTKDLQTPREKTICTHTIEGKSPLEIPDLGKDDRFKNIESVKAAGATYYYGIPLVSKEGFSIGSLCVISLNKLELSKEKKELLKIIAKELIQRLEALRETKKLKRERLNLKTINMELAHDLRGMVNGISGLGELIKFENKGENEEINKYLKLQKGSCASILEYIDNLLSSNPSGEDESLTNIDRISSKLERLYLPLAIKKEIHLKVSIDEENSDQVFDHSMILQIVGNLVSNAIKFTPKDGEVSVHFKIIEKENKSKKSDLKEYDLEITVSDTGMGMTNEKVAEILKTDVVSTDGTKGEKGYGLGLNLVQHHIDELNGNLEIDSYQGKGSIFKVSIPVI